LKESIATITRRVMARTYGQDDRAASADETGPGNIAGSALGHLRAA
jgi:hypothetical protein